MRLRNVMAAGLALMAMLPLARASHIDQNIRNARDKVFPALVNVQPILELYRGGQKVMTGASIGSGVIFSKEGHVLTNFHVAGHAEKVICTLSNKERVNGKVIGGDAWTDLAVFQIDLDHWRKHHKDEPIPFSELGDSSALEIGEPVLVMGSPRGLARSVTQGIVSNTDRYLGFFSRLPTGERTGIFNTWIQTDAAINPGNSGGPLVDLSGKVVGINSRAFVGNTNNLGFALPINLAREVAQEILEKGRVVRSSLGVRLSEIQDVERHLLGKIRTGVLVASVEQAGPAQKAGVRAGDLIQRMDGKPVSARFAEELPRLYTQIARFQVGSTHKLSISREGQVVELELVTEELTQIRGKESEASDWGLTLQDLAESQKRQLDISFGVFVTGIRPGGLAEKAEIFPGDVIQFVDGKKIGDAKAFQQIVKQTMSDKQAKRVIGVRLMRGRGRYIKAVRLGE